MNYLNMYNFLDKYEKIAENRTKKFLVRKELSDSFYWATKIQTISSMLKSMKDINLKDNRLSLIPINNGKNFAIKFQYNKEKDIVIVLGDKPDTLAINGYACFTISKFCGFTELYEKNIWYCERVYKKLSDVISDDYRKYSSEYTPESIIGFGKELQKINDLFRSLRSFEVNASNCNHLNK